MSSKIAMEDGRSTDNDNDEIDGMLFEDPDDNEEDATDNMGDNDIGMSDEESDDPDDGIDELDELDEEERERVLADTAVVRETVSKVKQLSHCILCFRF
jgi:hypothetical protein